MTDVPGSILVTGCYRCGTTVVEKILNMHPAVTVASQPFPVLYFLSKERFNRSIGIQRRYPLDHLFLEDAYTMEELEAFLHRDLLDEDALRHFVSRLSNYPRGLWTPEILDVLDDLRPGTFFEFHAQLNRLIGERVLPKKGARYVGGKEVLVEELALPLIGTGCRAVFVVRDPRAMIASLNFRERDNLTGERRPMLYSLRAWRKSVAMAIAAVARGGGYMVRYEDVVRDTDRALAGATTFLGIDGFAADAFADGIVDQKGNAWCGNSSFGPRHGIASSSVDAYAERVPDDVIRFTETVCGPEMALLGYAPRDASPGAGDPLEGFSDRLESVHEKFSGDYSGDPSRLERERERLRLLETGLQDSAAKRRWFITVEAYEALAKTRGPT